MQSHQNSTLVIGDVGCLVGLISLSVVILVCLVMQVDLTGVINIHKNKPGIHCSMNWLVTSGLG